MVTPWRRAARRPVRTEWLTDHAEKRFRAEVHQMPELAALVATAIVPARLSGPGGGSGIAAERSIANLDAVTLVAGAPGLDASEVDPMQDHHDGNHRGRPILEVLLSWARLAYGEMLDVEHEGATDPDGVWHAEFWPDGRQWMGFDPPTIEGLCAWLQRHMVWVLEQQWVVELAADVHRLTGDCRRVLRERPEYRPACPKCPKGQLIDKGAGYWSCPECGTTERDSRMGLRQVVLKQQPMTGEQLHSAFGVSRDLVRQWVARGHLEAARGANGHLLLGRDGAHRYHIVDVLRLIDTSPKVHQGRNQ